MRSPAEWYATALIVAFLVPASALLGVIERSESDNAQARFRTLLGSVTNMHLQSRTNTVVITNASTIADFTTAIGDLHPKDPCRCVHVDRVLFTGPKDEMSVSICSHCFVLAAKDEEGRSRALAEFQMPKGFYELFIKHMRDKHYLASEKPGMTAIDRDKE